MSTVERRMPEPETLILTAEQMNLPEVKAMHEKRDAVAAAHRACPALLEAEREYDAAWAALVAKVNLA